MKPLTVILPAAGNATRLRLPYPKEILSVEKYKSLIDYSFDFFRDSILEEFKSKRKFLSLLK